MQLESYVPLEVPKIHTSGTSPVRASAALISNGIRKPRTILCADTVRDLYSTFLSFS